MDLGQPQPWVERDGDNLLVAYRTWREGHFAILRFSGVRDFSFGEESHALPAVGMQSCRFYRVHHPNAEATGFQRWIITFLDEALDVTALAATVVVRAVQAVDSTHAIAALRA